MEKGQQYFDLVWGTIENWYTKFAKFTPNFIVGLVVFLAIYFASSYLTKALVQLFKKKFPAKDDTLLSFIGFFRFLILVLGTFISLEIMGLSGFLWKFIGSLGVAGVIAGVALKDLVSSMFSGILVGVDKAFKAGDYIQIAGHSGTVQEIGFLTTKLLTDDGKKVYIPNQVIFNAPFFNITAAPQRKIILNFEIPYGEDIEKARLSILDEIHNMDFADKTDAAAVIFTDIKNGNFNLQANFWLKTDASYLSEKSNAILLINKRLSAENIKLVTPTSINISPS